MKPNQEELNNRLLVVAIDGDLAGAKQAIAEGADVYAKDKHGDTPLDDAISEHSSEVLHKSEEKEVDYDPVNRPAHYNQGGIECIEAIRAALTEEEFRGYLKGNALKYIWRERHKGNSQQDIKKAIWYLGKLID